MEHCTSPAHGQRPALLAAAVQLQIALEESTADRLLGFLHLLQRWNSTYNLTAVRDQADMLTQHLVDCLAVLAPLHRQLGAVPRRILDVGSGGGLPGVVMAIASPESEVVCVDSVGKKAAFIRQVAAELKLPNLRGEHARVENLRPGAFELVTSRAFAPLADFVSLTRQHLKPEAVWMAMKGRRPDAEIGALPADTVVFHVEQLKVPGLDAERCLVWIRPAPG